MTGTTAVSYRLRRAVGAIGLLLLVVLGTGVFWFVRSGYGLYIVHTGSMRPAYNSGDLLVERAAEPYARGDVITFEHGAGPADLVTHRIISITADGIRTKGDGNRSADPWVIAPEQVRGTVVGNLPNLGYAAYYLKQPAGVGSLMTVAVSILLLWGLCFPARPRDEAETETETADALDVPQQRRGAPSAVPQPRAAEGVRDAVDR